MISQIAKPQINPRDKKVYTPRVSEPMPRQVESIPQKSIARGRRTPPGLNKAPGLLKKSTYTPNTPTPGYFTRMNKPSVGGRAIYDINSGSR